MNIGIDIDDTLTYSTRVVKEFIEKYDSYYCDDKHLINNIGTIIRGFLVDDETRRFFRDHSREIGEAIEIKEDAKEVIDKLIEKKYLDDAYYAKCYIADHINLSMDGPYKIIKHLEDNDISKNIYAEYLSKYNDLWKERIDKYINKQLKTNKKSTYFFKNKMLVNLVNLGYEKEMINDSLNYIKIDNLDELKEIEKEKLRKRLSRKYTGDELERKIKEKLFQKGFFN